MVAGEGWHPGVVGIVASRLVERWRRPCVVIALDDPAAGDFARSGRGSGRSISAYDLHAGLAACSEHLIRFGGHRMAAGSGARRGRGRRRSAARSPPMRRRRLADDLIPVERVDAVVPGGDLGLELAEDLELLARSAWATPSRPCSSGRPLRARTGMGEEKEHSRFTLVTAGGAKSRGVAFRSPPRELRPARSAHDIALRLEKNRWKGVDEPRVILRALCRPSRVS